MVAGCYLGFVWGPSSTPCKCCELQRKQISMGILFPLGFEWRALLNLLWPVTGLLQQPSKESERHQHLTTSKADKTNFRIRKPWLAAGTVYGSALHLALLGLQLRLLSSISIYWNIIIKCIYWYIIIKCMYLYVIMITCTSLFLDVFKSQCWKLDWIGVDFFCFFFFLISVDYFFLFNHAWRDSVLIKDISRVLAFYKTFYKFINSDKVRTSVEK